MATVERVIRKRRFVYSEPQAGDYKIVGDTVYIFDELWVHLPTKIMYAVSHVDAVVHVKKWYLLYTTPQGGWWTDKIWIRWRSRSSRKLSETPKAALNAHIWRKRAAFKHATRRLENARRELVLALHTERIVVE